MDDQRDTPAGSTPPPPPPVPPPPAPGPAPAGSDNRTLMLVLAYAWILCLVPLLVEKEDADVQWHAKHGLVLLGGEIALYIVLSVFGLLPLVGCAVLLLVPLLFLGALALRIVAILKATRGERLQVPGLTPLVAKL
jgi:uncharacterized membrane protein